MKIILIILLILLVVYILLTYSLFLTGFRRFHGNKVPKKATDNSTGKAWKAYGDIIRAGIEWFKAQPYENVEIRSFDGLRLRAMLLEAEAPGASSYPCTAIAPRPCVISARLPNIIMILALHC